MGLRNKLVALNLVFVLTCFGCSLTGNIVGDWMDTDSMEEYGDQVYETLVILRKYIGKPKSVILEDFGEPHQKDGTNGTKSVFYQKERVEFDEEWEYCYSRGVILINYQHGCKFFYFKDGVVVSVDAM